jgi:seryl-tRNA synthetase
VIDARLLRDDPDAVRAAQQRRGLPTDVVDELVGGDEQRRSSIATFEAVRAEQKNLGKLIPQAQGDEKQQLLARTKQLSQQVKESEAAQTQAAETFERLLKSLPNLASEDAPQGGEDDFVVLETIGTPRDFAAEGFEPRTASSSG